MGTVPSSSEQADGLSALDHRHEQAGEIIGFEKFGRTAREISSGESPRQPEAGRPALATDRPSRRPRPVPRPRQARRPSGAAIMAAPGQQSASSRSPPPCARRTSCTPPSARARAMARPRPPVAPVTRSWPCHRSHGNATYEAWARCSSPLPRPFLAFLRLPGFARVPGLPTYTDAESPTWRAGDPPRTPGLIGSPRERAGAQAPTAAPARQLTPQALTSQEVNT